MNGGTAKTVSTISAASERTGGVGGGKWETEGHRVVWHASGYPIRRETVGVGERAGEGGFCGKIGPKIFSTASNPRNSVLDRSGEEYDKEEVKGR